MRAIEKIHFALIPKGIIVALFQAAAISNAYHVAYGPDRLNALMSHSLFANRISGEPSQLSEYFRELSNEQS